MTSSGEKRLSILLSSLSFLVFRVFRRDELCLPLLLLSWSWFWPLLLCEELWCVDLALISTAIQTNAICMVITRFPGRIVYQWSHWSCTRSVKCVHSAAARIRADPEIVSASASDAAAVASAEVDWSFVGPRSAELTGLEMTVRCHLQQLEPVACCSGSTLSCFK